MDNLNFPKYIYTWTKNIKAEQIPFSPQLLPLEALNSVYSAHHFLHDSKRNLLQHRFSWLLLIGLLSAISLGRTSMNWWPQTSCWCHWSSTWNPLLLLKTLRQIKVKKNKNNQEISYTTKRKGKVWDSVNKGKYLGQYPKLHFHKQFLVGLSLTSVSRQTKHCLEETLEEDDLPCNVPSNKEQSKTPSKKACYHYPDQTSPTPSLRHLHKVHKDLVTYLLSEK